MEKIAAGTLKMTLMIAFKFSMMKTTASRFEKNLYARTYIERPQKMEGVEGMHSRNEEVHETVFEE